MPSSKKFSPGEGLQRGKAIGEDDVEGHVFRGKNAPDEFKTKITRSRVSGEDDVEGHGLNRSKYAAEELAGKKLTRSKATGEDDVEGHLFRGKNAPDELTSSRHTAKVAGEDDVEGHWMPDPTSSMRLAKVRNSEVERGARQHQLANDARQHRLEHDAKRPHQKG